MKWWLTISTCCVMFAALGCTRSAPEKKPVEVESTDSKPAISAAAEPVKKTIYTKEFREALHFAASLERESLRLISKDNSFEPATLFSVLSYAIEVAAGAKPMVPPKLDCSRFLIEGAGTKELRISKICERPSKLLATVKMTSEGRHLDVSFNTKEWAPVVGLSVTLTNPDIECALQIKDKKLDELNCDHWAYFLSANEVSATEIHLKTMAFHRGDELQLHLSGGFYRDLIERKKIEIRVPLQGKIKLIEKEIEVKDDFAEKPKPTEEPHGQKENSKEGVKDQNKESVPDDSQQKEKDYQKWIQGQSQDASQGEGQSQQIPEGQNQVPEGQIQVPNENQIQKNGAEEGFPPGEPVRPEDIEQGPTSGGVPKQPNRGR